MLGMTPRSLALLALFVVGCAGETRFVQPAGQDDAWLRDAAAERWAEVGVAAPSGYSILFLDQDTLADSCNADISKLAVGAEVGACSFPGVILVPYDADPLVQVDMVTHELGHLRRYARHGEDDHRHLDCGAEVNHGAALGGDVMCLTGSAPGALPTARDAAFVTR